VIYTVGSSAGVAYAITATDDAFASGLTGVMVSVGGAPTQYIVTPSISDPPGGSPIIITAQLADRFGNPVREANRLVSWTYTGSGGSLSTQTSPTDVNGWALVTLRTGTSGGSTYSVAARDVAGLTGTSESIVVQPAITFAKLAKGLGSVSSCAIAASGKAYCWGNNDDAQLGNGTTRSRPLYGPVSGNLDFAAIAVGDVHACGLTTSGAVYCWGTNSQGQLGNGSRVSQTTPAATVGGLTFSAITVGSAHSCALTQGGLAYCWGSNANGRLGIASTVPLPGPPATAPAKVAGDNVFSSITNGAAHTCAIAAGGAAYCWGSNGDGQLGDGTQTDRSAPVPVAGARTFTALSAGVSHTCGIVTDGSAYCWGSNAYNQLGLETDGALVRAPAQVIGGLTFTAVSAAAFHTCGIITSGAAYCWGASGEGELGTGNAAVIGPAAVAFGLQFKELAAGGNDYSNGSYYYGTTIYAHTCGLTTANVLYCWGSNQNGELGLGAILANSTIPVKVEGQP
jgi:alpha-tubulin suppressor-like RCC1 family protein